MEAGLDLGELMNAARRRRGIRSDRQLSLALGLCQVAVYHWRYGTSLPDDANLVKLCEMAGYSPFAGLLSLNILRSGEPAAGVYREMLTALQSDLPETAQAAGK